MFIQLERHFVFYQPRGRSRESRDTLAAKKNPQQKGEAGSFPKRLGYGVSILGLRSAQALNPGRVTKAFLLSRLRGQKTRAGIQGIFRTRSH